MSDLPLILVHGSFGEAADWDALKPLFARRDVRPVELPAHGARYRDSARSFTEVALELATQLPARADLVGYSLGGRVALAAALRAPERVRSVVLESASAGLDPAERVTRRRRDEADAARLVEDPEGFLDAFWSAPLFDSFRAWPGFQAERARGVERARRAPARLAATYSALSPGRMPDLRPALAELGVPLLFVAGALDTKYTAIGAECVALAPNAELAVIADAGHNVHLEQPAAFALRLRAFWQALETRGA
ncbi:MAG: alpha/beta fold hydrolase [Planctomycetota bacterium]